MKKLNFKIELKRKSLFHRICSSLVRFIVDHGWCGETLLPNEFIQEYSKATSTKIGGRVFFGSSLGPILIRYRKEVKKHFNTDKYPLDLNFIRSEVLTDFFKTNIEDYITAHLVKGLPVDELLTLKGSRLVKK